MKIILEQFSGFTTPEERTGRILVKILIVIAHPDSGSFNHAIAAAVMAELTLLGHDYLVLDLYGEKFPPELPLRELHRDAHLSELVKHHTNLLTDADGIVIIHPNWWGGPPAVLKGWVDRIFRPDIAYRFVGEDGGEGTPEGLLKADKAAVFNTTNTYPEREKEVFGDPLERIWKDCIFGLCGVDDVVRKNFGVVCTSTDEERKIWLSEVKSVIRGQFG